MPAPTLRSQTGSTWTDVTSATRVTGTLTWVSGDLIVVGGVTEDNTSATLGVPTATGLTFTQLTVTNTASTCKLYIWTAKATADGSSTISSTISTSTKMGGIHAWAYGGTGGTGAVANKVTGTGDTLSLTRLVPNSAVIWIGGDFGATNDVTVTSVPASGGTQREAATVAAHATMFAFDWTDQGAPGATSYGIAAFTTVGIFSMIALEITGWTPRATLATVPNGQVMSRAGAW
jgi:hypothetical protein